jgi:hypothetical protein
MFASALSATLCAVRRSTMPSLVRSKPPPAPGDCPICPSLSICWASLTSVDPEC